MDPHGHGDLTVEECQVIQALAGWALDQAHDARAAGDPTYLEFLVDAAEPNEEQCEQIEAVIESLAAKLA